MQENTLRTLHAELPSVRLLQTYGLSEVGILRSKSKENNSLFMKIGGENYETRVVDNMLEIKATTAMIGYLNAPSPFTEDGWFKTDDMVEIDGEFIRVLGRKSEIINVGGEKVYPAEVENVIQTMDGVQDVAVIGVPHPIIGNIVSAKIRLLTDETISDFRVRMRLFCKDKLENFKVPQQVSFVVSNLYGERFKKMRKFL